MISAAELRKQQESRDTGSEEKTKIQFEDNFSLACDMYYHTIMEEATKIVIRAKGSNRKFGLLNSESLMQKFNGFNYTSPLYGFWNSEGHEFDKSIFEKSNIVPPFTRAATELEKLGYKLENISDSNKSFKIFIKLSW